MGLSKKWITIGVLGAGLTLSMATAWLAQATEAPLPESDSSSMSTSNPSSSQPPVQVEMMDVVVINPTYWEWEKETKSIMLFPGQERNRAIANATGVSTMGYNLTEVKETEINEGLTQYELVLGEKNKNWKNISATRVFTALDSFWQTLTLYAAQEGKQIKLYIRRENGEPVVFTSSLSSDTPAENAVGWSIASDRPYTGVQDDMRWRQSQIPLRISPRVYPNVPESGTVAFYHVGPVTTDPNAQEILAFIQAVMPKGYVDYATLAFDQPSEADMGFIKRAAFRAVVHYGYDYESEQDAMLLTPISQMMDNREFVLSRDLQWVGEQFFGEGVMIEHGSLGDKTWGYNEISGAYSHFPGGTGDEYLGGSYQVLLDYVDHGETVTATIAWLRIGVDNYLSVSMRDGTDKEFEMVAGMEGGVPADLTALWRSLTTETPRAQVILTKKPEGGYWFTGYHYLG